MVHITLGYRDDTGTPTRPVSRLPNRFGSVFGFLFVHGFALLAGLGFEARSQTAPRLVSVTPVDGATLVPTTSSLVFVFDQDMDTAVPPFQSIANVIAGNFEVLAPNFNQSLLASWGADKRTLTIKPAIQFPYATFTWRLNPTGSIFPFKSKTGVALATVSGTFATGVGGTAPKLGSSNPANNATRVDLDIQVVFNFDQVMKTNTAIAGAPPAVAAAVAWSGTGLDPAKFTYSWSANGRSLVCDYTGDLPPSTEIGWELNPPAAPVQLENPAGLRLPSGTYSGHFRTGSGIPCDPTPPRLTGAATASTAMAPSSSAPPATRPPLSGGQGFTFGTFVTSPPLGPAATNGSLTRPDGSRTNLLTIPGNYLQSYERAGTDAALDALAPPGPYTLRFTQVGSPERSIVIDVPTNHPPIPRITNFEAAQAIDANADFVLAWNGIPDAGERDSISLTVVGADGRLVFMAPDPCVPLELPASATSVVIPARTLPTNSLASATLVFNRLYYFSTNEVPKMSGFANLGRTVQFNLATGSRPAPASPATFSEYRLLANGRPQLLLSGSPGRAYTIQRAGTPGPAAGWSTVATVTPDAAGRTTFEDSQTGASFPRFYRAVAE
jgi:hypothetical protein